jgi:hypothetical protein
MRTTQMPDFRKYPQQPVKELQNLDATDNVALFFSFIHMLLKKIKQYS